MKKIYIFCLSFLLLLLFIDAKHHHNRKNSFYQKISKKPHSHKDEQKNQNDDKQQENIFSYQGNHKSDWKGVCGIGKKQSPVNIVHDQNTVNVSSDFLDFKYEMTQKFLDKKAKLTYEGTGTVVLEAEIGKFTFTKPGTKTVETFTAEKITFHYPAEHLVTIGGLTVRYPLEMQIHHKFKDTTNSEESFKEMQFTSGIISIFFDELSKLPQGDVFFARLGLDPQLNKASAVDSLNLGDKIEKVNHRDEQREVFFDQYVLDHLIDIINYDSHIYRYFGSQTVPPCLENVEWFVFARPRSLKTEQMNFFKNQALKVKQNSITGYENINFQLSEFFGNNRKINSYDIDANGYIHSLKLGIKSIKGLSMPKN